MEGPLLAEAALALMMDLGRQPAVSPGLAYRHAGKAAGDRREDFEGR